jgi:hypothetical protein
VYSVKAAAIRIQPEPAILENRCGATHREFESRPLRQICTAAAQQPEGSRAQKPADAWLISNRAVTQREA